MRDFETLTRRGQLGRLRALSRSALARYGIEHARVRPLGYAENATFDVQTADARYVLRMNRPHVHTAQAVASEMAWLAALRRETELQVPEPVAARDGLLVSSVTSGVVPEPRLCVLLRWLDGRFVDRALTPAHFERVGDAIGTLQVHAAGWTPPPSFVRPAVGTLTDLGKARALPSAALALEGEHPSLEDGDRALALIESCLSSAEAALVAEIVEVIRATSRELARTPGSFGLLHGDLHHENFLFHRARIRVIDFDDCGWAFDLYDLAVTLSEIDGRSRYAELREALLAGYAQQRQLPVDYALHLDRLLLLRRLQLLVWVLESRARPSFRDHWQDWAREDIGRLRTRLQQ